MKTKQTDQSIQGEWEEIKILLEENGLQWKYDFTHVLVDKLYSLLSRQAQVVCERVEGMKKRLDVGDFGVDSVSFPSGEIWTQEKRMVFNQALSQVQEMIRKEWGV